MDSVEESRHSGKTCKMLGETCNETIQSVVRVMGEIPGPIVVQKIFRQGSTLYSKM